MKKLLPLLLVLTMGFGGTAIAQQNMSEGTSTPSQSTPAERYAEISNLDKSGMSNKEKRELKQEQAEIEKELKAANTSKDPVVIYVSSGVVLVLIIILLIILL